MSLSPGVRLGPYEVVALLGAGGMGELFRARFERESRAVAALNHPHICAIHEVGEAPIDGQPNRQYLVLELVEGETLAERLTRGPLPVAEALGLTRQVLLALVAAHRAGLVHRDLKPGNVMLRAAVPDRRTATCVGVRRHAAALEH